MRHVLHLRRRTGQDGWPRRVGALYALAFLLAATFAPHRHLNSFKDLLSEGPSDSGIFVQGNRSLSGETEVSSAQLIDDAPCLACFHHDYTTSVNQLFVFGKTFLPAQRIPRFPPPAILEPAAGSPASRSPPSST
jgi:hypothetical protein